MAKFNNEQGSMHLPLVQNRIMRKGTVVILFAILSACGSSSSEESGPKEPMTSETIEKLEKAQNENIELEKIDGELDSLMNSIN